MHYWTSKHTLRKADLYLPYPDSSKESMNQRLKPTESGNRLEWRERNGEHYNYPHSLSSQIV